MRKNLKRLGIIIGIGISLILIWLFLYQNQKNIDNIPSKKTMYIYISEKGEDYALTKIEGYSNRQMREVWGEPDGMLSGMYGEIWVYEGYNIIIYYDNNDKVNNVILRKKEI